MHKRCTSCEVSKPATEFISTKRRCDIEVTKCASCRERSHLYYVANREKRIAAASQNQRRNKASRVVYLKSYMTELRRQVIEKFGSKCGECGYSDVRALQIDHVNGDGWTELRKHGMNTYSYLIKVLHDATGRYQLLCANCNWIKRLENDERGAARRASE